MGRPAFFNNLGFGFGIDIGAGFAMDGSCPP